MTKHTDNEFPSNWHSGGGDAGRPLVEGGYYNHRYYRVLPGSNQHVEHFLELVVDTSGMPPDAHHVELSYCTEDGTEVTRRRTLETDSVRVRREKREDEAVQERAEQDAHDRAERLMGKYADWRP